MKSTLIWFLVTGAILFFGGCSVDAWNRQLFNRYSRNLYRNSDDRAKGANNEIDELNALFGINAHIAGNRGAGGGAASAVTGGGQQQTEVYGIVEPLIEDMPCVDRPCNVNDDCCPTGVCVNTYGEGKCIYVYGRKRDLCHRNVDCELGMACLKGSAGNLFCQPTVSERLMAVTNSEANTLETKTFGEDCVSSSDCNVVKGMCCQLQRSHQRLLPKKMCTYFRDPFMCIDILPTDDEEIRESRFLSSFSQRRM